MEMNSSQLEAVRFVKGPALCIAGPGSGKTAVLTHRIAYLIKQGIPAESIMVITFTNAAALEMSQRFYMLCPEHPPVSFGTFHSTFFSILKEELKLSNNSILTGLKRLNLLKEACSDLNLDDSIDSFYDNLSKEFSFITNSMIDINIYESHDFSSEIVKSAYKKYKELKKTYNCLDFDDMLSMTYEILSTNQTVLNKWQRRFNYFLIDEVQDMNMLQFNIISLLASHTNNIFCVGDDDQSIYAFRGANPSIMLNFESYYPDCKIILLNQNYRSPSLIVNKALSLISHNQNRFEKNIIATVDTGSIRLLPCEDTSTQATLLVDNIITSANTSNTQYNEIAVLYRNKNDALPVIKELVERHIPFFIKDSMPNMYTHWIIEDIVSYLMLAQSKQSLDRSRFIRIMNRPNRFISVAATNNSEKHISFESIQKFYQNKPFMLERIITLQNSLNMISKMKPVAAINYIRKGIGYDEFLKDTSYEKHIDIKSLFEIADMLTAAVHNCKNIQEAVSLIFDLRKAIDYKNEKSKLERDAGVGLFTLHSSKGLEYKDVHIINVNEGSIPCKKAISKEQLEEERRMFYVGITRAKSNLYIYYTNKKRTDKTYPSRFISELNLSDA